MYLFIYIFFNLWYQIKIKLMKKKYRFNEYNNKIKRSAEYRY